MATQPTPAPKSVDQILADLAAKERKNEVTLEVGGKQFSASYERQDVFTVPDLLERIEKDPVGVIKAYNYGLDLQLRAEVRQKLSAQAAGPEKALQQMADAIMKVKALAGKEITRERALELAKMQMDAD